MKINEAKRIGKLSDELLLFLVANDHHNVNIDVLVGDKDIVLTITTSIISEINKKKLITSLSVPRNYAIEEYGWELLGESECSIELDLVGMCFDEFDLIEGEECNIIKLRRKF